LIPDNLEANNLLKFTWNILIGLHSCNIRVAAYATDGSNIKHSVQDKLEAQANQIKEVQFKHPVDNGLIHNDIIIPILWFGDQPMAILQDPKHLLKTCHNNSFSGAQVPILPNYPILFANIHAMAYNDSPLYLRDVKKVDHQDDNAVV
jgi:hypothetical protein